MAQVTVELGNLLKTDFELFDFDYEFDDENMKKELEQAIIDYYWDYEIGKETPDAFKHTFKRRWLSAMSYYNKLHNTTLLEYNPLINYKMEEALNRLSEASRTQKTTREGKGTTNVEGTSNEDIESTSEDHTDQNTSSRNTREDDLQQETITDEQTSDYPQQPIAGGDYLDGARQTDSTTKNTGTAKDTGTSDTVTNSESSGQSTTTREDEQKTTARDNEESNLTGSDNMNENYEKTLEGITGISYQELIQKERTNILRITTMVIEEMKPCFILVY